MKKGGILQRVICLAMVAALSAGCGGGGETGAFAFRDIHWGMTVDEVLALEAGKADSTLCYEIDRSINLDITAYGYDCNMDVTFGERGNASDISLAFEGLSLDEALALSEEIQKDYPVVEDVGYEEDREGNRRHDLNYDTDDARVIVLFGDAYTHVIFYDFSRL